MCSRARPDSVSGADCGHATYRTGHNCRSTNCYSRELRDATAKTGITAEIVTLLRKSMAKISVTPEASGRRIEAVNTGHRGPMTVT